MKLLIVSSTNDHEDNEADKGRNTQSDQAQQETPPVAGSDHLLLGLSSQVEERPDRFHTFERME